jgi:polyribonucleotide nucleotidyltransferase
VFDMVVAGRVVGDDVAIMMVEAEATEAARGISSAGRPGTDREVVAEGLEAAKPFIRQLCEAQSDLAEGRQGDPEFPVFLDYQDDAYAAVEAAASDKLAQALTIAGKQERESALDAIKDELVLEPARRAVRGPREGGQRGCRA